MSIPEPSSVLDGALNAAEGLEVLPFFPPELERGIFLLIAELGEREVRVSCTNSKCSQNVQRAYAVHQLVLHRRRDLFHLHRDQTLRSDTPISCYIAEVWCEQQRTEWLSRSGGDPGCLRLPFCRRCGRESPGNVV